MKFLLIGNGFIAPVHQEAIKSVGGEITEIFGLEKGGNYWKEAIEKTEADCVVILTPNDLHFEMAKTAVKMGKIALCEKPLVIKSEQAKILAEMPNIFTVLQLRYHPLLKEIRESIKNNPANKIEMDISVYRDDNYYKSWKGKIERSGGVLFNLGIHYFDLILYLFGDAKKTKTAFLNDKTGRGSIEGNNYICNWKVSTDEKKENQRRIFKINGVDHDYNFSSKDNLAYENLHKFVYQDLLKGRGVKPKEELKAIELIENLYKAYENFHS